MTPVMIDADLIEGVKRITITYVFAGTDGAKLGGLKIEVCTREY